MASFTRIQTSDVDLRQGLEASFRACEIELGCSLTLHDLQGLCRDEAGTPLSAHRNQHAHPVCRCGRQETFARCEAHCVDAVHAEACRRRRPFVTCCWKGVREIVVPLQRDDQVVAVLFAGAWRRPRARPDFADLPQAVRLRAAVAALPVWDQSRAAGLAEHLQVWGEGLLDRLVRAGPASTGGTRAERIRAFILRHGHEPVRLADLAAELGCSVSRAGHIVVEELGVGFKELVLTERLDRAKVLLLTSSRPLAAIATSIGFSNEYYFNRVFSRRFGVSPGRWRQARRRSWQV